LRLAIATTLPFGLSPIAGITRLIPIFAVLKIPQFTLPPETTSLPFLS
jgi:hypothetical protein